MKHFGETKLFWSWYDGVDYARICIDGRTTQRGHWNNAMNKLDINSLKLFCFQIARIIRQKKNTQIYETSTISENIKSRLRHCPLKFFFFKKPSHHCASRTQHFQDLNFLNNPHKKRYNWNFSIHKVSRSVHLYLYRNWHLYECLFLCDLIFFRCGFFEIMTKPQKCQQTNKHSHISMVEEAYVQKKAQNDQR